jgi:hypothetical protein
MHSLRSFQKLVEGSEVLYISIGGVIAHYRRHGGVGLSSRFSTTTTNLAPALIYWTAHHDFPHHDPKRIHIAGGVQAAVIRHFGGGVEGRALSDVADVAAVVPEAHCEPKVCHLHPEDAVPDGLLSALCPITLHRTSAEGFGTPATVHIPRTRACRITATLSRDETSQQHMVTRRKV